MALFLAGLAISIASCAGRSVDSIPTTYQFGLFEMLPSLFWVGLALSLVSLVWRINADGEKAFVFKAMLLSLLIWNVPTLLLANPYAPGSYMHPYESMPIMLTGHVPAVSESLPWPFRFYPAEFPGYHIVLVSLFQIANVSAVSLAKYYPILSSLFTFLAVLLFFRTYVPSLNYRWALLISVLANAYFQLHLSPQSTGLIAGLLMLVALERPGVRWKAMATILFLLVVVSHPTTAFVLLPIIGIAWLLRIALRRSLKACIDLVPVLALLWLGWMLIGAGGLGGAAGQMAAAIASGATGPAVAGGDMGAGTGIPLIGSLIGEAGQHFQSALYVAPSIRFMVLVLFGLGSGYYVLTQWLTADGRRERHLAMYTAFIAAPIVMTILDVAFLDVGGLHDRYFLMFLLATPVLLVRLLERGLRPPGWGAVGVGDAGAAGGDRTTWRDSPWKRVALAALVLAALANFSTMYYRALLSVQTDDIVHVSTFANDECRSSEIIGWWLIPDLEAPYESAVVRRVPLYRNYPQLLTESELPTVVLFGEHERVWFDVRGSVEIYEFYAQSDELDTALAKVYSNGAFDVYWFEGTGG